MTMKTSALRAARLLAVAAIPLITTTSVGPATAATDASVQEAFDEAQQALAGLPAGALGRFQRASLRRKLDRAETLYGRGAVCRAVGVLGNYLRQTQALREGTHVRTAESLHNLGRLVVDLILPAAPPPCGQADAGAEPQVQVVASDNRHLTADVVFGRARLSSILRGEDLWTRVSLPGVESQFGQTGLPAVPFFSTLVAVPQGAEVKVQAVPTLAESVRLNLYPVQDPAAMADHGPDEYFGEDPPPDEVYADKPFKKDDGAYAADAAFPAELCTAEEVGQYRDLRIARLRCAAARYNPVSDQLDLFQAFRIEVTFAGGEGTFLTERARSPFEPLLPAKDATLNRDAVDQYVALAPTDFGCLGEELVILTSAALKPSADALALYRDNHGVPTSVFVVNDGAGPGPDTPTAIRNLVIARYNNCKVRPSYVLLFGDAEHVPTWYWPNPVHPEDVIASDYPYALYPQHLLDFGLDFAVGRLPVDQAHAALAVSNIVAYEQNPPAQPLFYDRAGIASQFQCCQYDPLIFEDVPQPPKGTDQRAFIQVVEDVRNRLILNGYTADRIYTETIDGGYFGDPTPKRYANQAFLPFALQAPFPWSGDTAGITAAWNAGRFAMIHLDHGWPGGWAHPGFGPAATSNLANGNLLPVVLSYNCSSGYFDDETDGAPNEPIADPTPNGHLSFTERLFRNPAGGAIGVISATRTTFATGNIMIRGALDAAIPTLDPAWGPSAAHRRLGDMLNHARNYMWSHSSASGTDLLRHNLLYNLFGDPTLKMWTDQPAMLPNDFQADASASAILVLYGVEGATITALQGSEEGTVPVGRGVVRDGVAVLPYFHPPDPTMPIELSASAENAVSVALTSR
jgi:hypothetical protein